MVAQKRKESQLSQHMTKDQYASSPSSRAYCYA